MIPIIAMNSANFDDGKPADFAPIANPKRRRRKSVINREYSLVVFINTARLDN